MKTFFFQDTGGHVLEKGMYGHPAHILSGLYYPNPHNAAVSLMESSLTRTYMHTHERIHTHKVYESLPIEKGPSPTSLALGRLPLTEEASFLYPVQANGNTQAVSPASLLHSIAPVEEAWARKDITEEFGWTRSFGVTRSHWLLEMETPVSCCP